MKLKVLYVIGNLDVGGAERHLVQVLPLLVKHGLDLTVFTLTHKGKQSPIIEGGGVRVIEPWFAGSLRNLPLALRRPLILLSSVISYVYLLIRWKPTIVHFFLPAAYLLGGIFAIPFGKKIFVMSRRSLNNYQANHRFLAKVEIILHGRMNAVLGNSVAVLNNLRQEGVHENRLGLIYNGIDLTRFDNLTSPSLIRRSLGVDDNILLLVCVANLIPYKGHADLIQALSLIRESLPSGWMIAMVGRDAGIGPELRRLSEALQVHGHILWLGERNDAVEIYSAADIGVLCSHEEGFSNSVLEGMAANLCMVVTDVGGNAEAILDGVCGIVVQPRAPEELSKVILGLSQNNEKRRYMAALGNRRVRDEFSVQGCVRRYAGLYEALLRDPHCEIQRAIDCVSVNLKD